MFSKVDVKGMEILGNHDCNLSMFDFALILNCY